MLYLCCTHFVILYGYQSHHSNTHFMPSLKIVLRKKANKDGTFPLAIRITKDRVSSFMHIGHSINENQWDSVNQRVKKNHPNSARLNNLLIAKKAETSDKLLELQTQKNDVSSRAIRNRLSAGKYATFLKQAEIYLEGLKQHGKFNRLSADKSRVERIRDFLDASDITFAEMNTTFLKRFMAWLKGEKGVSDRTVANYLVMIRTIFNQAIAANIVDRKYYPFGKGKIVIRFPDSLKIGLTPEEVKAIEDLELPQGSILNHARNLWLFSFYFAGMRISDVLRLKWSDFQNDRLYYAMGKNDKGGSLKVPEKALAILNYYKRENPVHNLVFPDLENVEDITKTYDVQRRINQKLSKIDKALPNVAKEAKITKKLTMHIARHTFGNISGEKIPIQMLQKLYRHTSITTTIGYQANFIHKSADEALDAIVNF